MTKRRGWHYLFIVWFTVASVLVPYRQARALVPLVPVAIALVDAVGTVLASQAVLNAGIGLLGAMALVAMVGLPGDTTIRIPLTDDQTATDAAMPAPSASASTGYQEVTISAAQNCADQGGTYQTWDGRCYVEGFGAYYVGPTTSYSCPSGYSDSSGGCVLSNPRAVSPDNNYDVSRSGGQLVAPVAEADTKPENLVIAEGGGKIWGTNAKGEPFVTTITPSAGGTTISTQAQTASGIQTNSITIAGSGTITNVGSTNTTGSITLPTTAGTVPTVSTGAASSPINITFPTDYARQGEAATAGNAINTRLDKIHDDLTKPAEAPEAPALPDTSEFTDGFFSKTFDDLKAWRLTSGGGQCPTADLSFTFFGHFFDLNLTAHCDLLESSSIQSVAQTSMQVMWLIGALFIVLGA